MNKFMKKSHKGFTIIQLVIGMLIFAILTGIAFYGVSVYTAQANETRVDSDLGTFEVAIKDYMLNNVKACSDGELKIGDLTGADGLNAYLTEENRVTAGSLTGEVVDAAASAANKHDTTLGGKSTLKDPWGHEYRVVIMNDTDGATDIGTDSAKIYVYTIGKDNTFASDKKDDSVLVVQYSDGEVYSRVYQPSDVKNGTTGGGYDGKMSTGIFAIKVG